MELQRYTFDGTVDLVKIAVVQLKSYEDIALQMNPNGYYVAYSGGKDSDVIRILCGLAGVKHELWHNHTTVDAPETVRYIRTIVRGENISQPYDRDGRPMSMWRLIVKKGMPPLRNVRYCCEVLKEYGGENRFAVTGVRKEESSQRSSREELEIVGKRKRDRKIFVGDNDERRREIENCRIRGRLTMNPIIHWHETDVWDFLKYYGCESNPLYKCGYKRVGCIGCPNSGAAGQLKQFGDYPKYKNMYIRAFDKMLKNHEKEFQWRSGEEVFDWWTGCASTAEKAEMIEENQITLFD